MALSDKLPALIHQDRAFHRLKGQEKCRPPIPVFSRRVWYQRTGTGGPTIYFFDSRPNRPVRSNYADHAFGWIPQETAIDIWLPSPQGYCNFWDCDSAQADELAEVSETTDDYSDWIEFTDDLNFPHIEIWTQGEIDKYMHELGKETEFKRQAQHWATPMAIAMAAGGGGQPGGPMGNFDPYAAQADQLNRLSKGQKVSNLQAKCASAVDTVLTNNKSAAKQAAFLEAGRIANNQLAKVAGKSLPMMMRGYADTPVGKLVIANLALTAAQHFKPGNAQLAKLTQAMAAQAYSEIYQNFKIEEMIDSFLADAKIQKALTAAGDGSED